MGLKGLWQAGGWTADEKGGYSGEISEDWCQGRTAFGGLLATAAIRAMQQRPSPPEEKDSRRCVGAPAHFRFSNHWRLTCSSTSGGRCHSFCLPRQGIGSSGTIRANSHPNGPLNHGSSDSVFTPTS